MWSAKKVNVTALNLLLCVFLSCISTITRSFWYYLLLPKERLSLLGHLMLQLRCFFLLLCHTKHFRNTLWKDAALTVLVVLMVVSRYALSDYSNWDGLGSTFNSPPPYLHMATSEMWCWCGGRAILIYKKLSLCYSIVCYDNGAKVRLYWALILLCFALCVCGIHGAIYTVVQKKCANFGGL